VAAYKEDSLVDEQNYVVIIVVRFIWPKSQKIQTAKEFRYLF
jgi:hypothetical protein